MSTTLSPTKPTALAPVKVARDRNPAVVYLARLAVGSRRSMKGALETIATMLSSSSTWETLPWASLRYQHTQAVRAKLDERFAASTTNRHLAALRGVLREAWRLELVEGDAFHRAVDIKSVRVDALPAGREISPGELRALFSACGDDKSAAGARDAALLAVLYGGGLRREEAVTLNVSDYLVDQGTLKVRHGKGRKQRIVHLARGARAAVDAWLAVRGAVDGPLLVPVNKGGKITPRRMTAQVARTALLKRAVEAKVTAFSPHDLRRTFVSHLLDAGADLSIVQRLAGHASVTTTARYDRRGEVAKAKAAEMLNVPFVGAHR